MKEATYLVIDKRTKTVVYEFKANGDFETAVVAFLSSYCTQTMTTMKTISIVAAIPIHQFESVGKRVDVAVAACMNVNGSVKLSKREHECSVMLAKHPGITNKEIASEMGICERTVKFHVSSLMTKFHVQNRSMLAFTLKSVPAVMEFVST